jgi:hypothetical protein
MNRSTKLKKVAKSISVEPVKPMSQTPPLAPLVTPVKRGRGRPKKVSLFSPEVGSGSATFEDAKKLTKDMNAKALIVFRRAIADAEKLLMTPSEFDGGGTQIDAPIVTKDSLQRRVARRLNVLDRFLTDDKLIELLSFSSLKEVGIYEGILLDKSLVLTGQPTVIIGNEDRGRLDSVLPKLMTELKRRGLITSLSERKIEFTSPSD